MILTVRFAVGKMIEIEGADVSAINKDSSGGTGCDYWHAGRLCLFSSGFIRLGRGVQRGVVFSSPSERDGGSHVGVKAAGETILSQRMPRISPFGGGLFLTPHSCRG